MFKLFLVFQSRLIIATIAVAACIGTAGFFMANALALKTCIGIGYLAAGPLVHGLIYEFLYPEEYLFYHNLGLTITRLRVSTIALSISIFIITLLM